MVASDLPTSACEQETCPDAVRKHRVLVVEDNRDLAIAWSWLLRSQGHEVEVAFDGREGLERAREFRPDVVLLDVGLPHVDGYELARRLRSEHGLGVLVIIVTAYSWDTARRREHEAYFDHHFTKPLDYSTIAEMLS
jgi:DNA-binding response OmpR family regulator